MDATRAQQKALDDELVAPADTRLKIGKSNLRLSSILKSKEPTLQVALDALKLTPFYNAFEISADVPEIYMQEFWVTVSRHHSSLRFKLNGKSHTINVDNSEITQCTPPIGSQRNKYSSAFSPAKDIDTGFEDISTSFEDISTGFEEVNTGGLGVSTVSGFEEVNTGGLGVSSARGQREGKTPMIVKETQAPKRTNEQIQQEEATQHYTEEDWDAIKAKLEANTKLTKSVLGKELSEEDFAKKMVELVNQRKKFFAEERAKARRSKPMTQSLLRNYMMNYLKNQGTWKLTQLKKLSFEEVKEEFDKLVKQVESFVPINIEATKAQLKRYGEELLTEISKKQRIDDKNVSDTEEKVGWLCRNMEQIGLEILMTEFYGVIAGLCLSPLNEVAIGATTTAKDD
ncbi:hypothetical protein Tco_1175365 [Tanacetum coccineum]